MRIHWAVGLLALMAGARLVPHAAEAAQARRKPAAPPARSGALSPAVYTRDIAPALAKYCGGCHGAKAQVGGIDFSLYKNEAAVVKARTLFEKTAQQLQAHTMPPRNMPQPSEGERARLVAWIEAKLSTADCNLKDPGRVTVRRLNRAEYNNTIRDLLGVDFKPAEGFPSDDVGYGFDNIGDVLSLPPLLMEKYLAAAETIAEAAIVTPDPKGPVRRFDGGRLQSTSGAARGPYLLLASSGEVYVQLDFPKAGDYLLRARAFGQQAGPDPARMAFRIDEKPLKEVAVPAVEASPGLYEIQAPVPAGRRRFGVFFTNDYYRADDPDPKNRDRNLAIDYLEVVGPLEPSPPVPESQKRLFGPGAGITDPKEKARKILSVFARRAFRRPVTSEEVDRLTRYVDLAAKEGESFERGIQLGVMAALVSPHFLFRVELDPAPNDPKAARDLTDFELATRLSYFLWSSMPDEELFSLAEQGKLKSPAVLEAQARRLLEDPKARALGENFAGQWLQVRNLANLNPDPQRFPAWNEALRAAMLKETELYFAAVVQEDRSVTDFLDSRFTYVNETLARHYGIPGVTGPQFRRVALTGEQRGGVLTQASVLTVTSNPTRTSPVKRGKWILEQILGTPPPPPPPNVPELSDDKPGVMLTGTLRQRMEQHRKNPSCASCHERMDTLGFGFENFDAIGAWRTADGDSPIDASGTLPDGKKFKGPAQLKVILKSQTRQFARSFGEKLLTYALGRGVEHFDRCALDKVVTAAGKKRYTFSALVTEIVKSDPFRMRRGEGEEP